jgi:2-iminobutanoate/2-iminopropanoate deaminase
MKIIDTEKMPTANGHYSQCIEHNGLLYISGQLAGNSIEMTLQMDIGSQAKIVLEKIEVILNQAGSSRDKVIQMRIYIPDIELWDRVNKVYTEFFGEHKPVRCIVPSGRLHYGCLIEAEAVAYI